MRCNNCGWDNQNGAFNCIKCDMPLDNRDVKSNVPERSKESQFSGTIPGAQVPFYSSEEEVITQQYQPREKPVENNIPSLISCSYPDCGYLFSKETKVCPKCNRAVLSNETPGYKADDVNQSKQQAGRAFTGTIDPYRKKNIEPEPVCHLTPVSKTGEPNEASPTGIPFRFSNAPVELNRDNLDPGNKSITSKIQAELVYENGLWYLLDKSELNTTFIVVRNRTVLKEGDIILMGDRKFIFTHSNHENEPII